MEFVRLLIGLDDGDANTLQLSVGPPFYFGSALGAFAFQGVARFLWGRRSI